MPDTYVIGFRHLHRAQSYPPWFSYKEAIVQIKDGKREVGNDDENVARPRATRIMQRLSDYITLIFLAMSLLVTIASTQISGSSEENVVTFNTILQWSIPTTISIYFQCCALVRSG